MRIVKVEPGKPAEICEIDGSLESMQDVVGGYIQVINPWTSSICLVCNEEGKNFSMTPNRVIFYPSGGYDIIYGTFFFCGSDGEEFADLTKHEADFLIQTFRKPAVFYFSR